MAQDTTAPLDRPAPEAARRPGLRFVHAQATRPVARRPSHGVPLFVGFGAPRRSFPAPRAAGPRGRQPGALPCAGGRARGQLPGRRGRRLLRQRRRPVPGAAGRRRAGCRRAGVGVRRRRRGRGGGRRRPGVRARRGVAAGRRLRGDGRGPGRGRRALQRAGRPLRAARFAARCARHRRPGAVQPGRRAAAWPRCRASRRCPARRRRAAGRTRRCTSRGWSSPDRPAAGAPSCRRAATWPASTPGPARAPASAAPPPTRRWTAPGRPNGRSTTRSTRR
ncbi:MAG: hypothetical protein MZW92_29825 [Comamonadaceae bacterium]|nr:hypothetical protein [Comamonadaceae bacterium]